MADQNSTPWTPGPWRVDPRASTRVMKADEPNRGICSAGGYMTNNARADALLAENEANARLIAAVPTMLALLQQIREEFRDTFDASCEPGEDWSGSARLSAATGEAVEELLRTMEVSRG